MADFWLLSASEVCEALRQAWRDSQPGETGGREEGGFILQDANGELSVFRWSSGSQNSIDLPSHTNCKIGELDIVATFHTHPNAGKDYLQEPSETDKRAVRDDLDLKGIFYEGEFIIAAQMVYFIDTNGQAREVGDTKELLKL